jgi:general secretion pathway protein E
MIHDALEACIRDAGSRGASDLSFEPDDEQGLQVVARIDGVRVPGMRIEASAAAQVLARMKALAQLPAYITDEAQDGSLDGRPFGIPGDLRISFLPTARGQRAAMRLPAIGALPSPDGLGLPEPVISRLRQLVRMPDGLLVVAGPTGSGKTTTLHSLISELARERGDRHVLSIEDPVERRLPGITQVEVAPERGFGFPEALSACLRHDPDVIVVGEVRDPATAHACVRAALTGHLVLTTVHAGRAHEAVPRLLEMGVDADLLLPALRAVMAQRLVRRRHGPCRGEGCSSCTGGYSGRQALADLLVVDTEARTRLRGGMRPVLEADLDLQAAALALSGITTPSEITRVMG